MTSFHVKESSRQPKISSPGCESRSNALGRIRTYSLCACISLVGCGDSKPSDGSGAGGGTLVISTNSDPRILFPPLIASIQARQAAESIYDYLVVVGPEMNIVGDAGFRPRLAESWKWSSDSLSIAFRINPKARWHDGRGVSANDVRYTWQVYTNPQLASPSADGLSDIDSVTVADSLTAAFWYRARSPHQFLDASQMMILPRHVFEKIPMDSLREAGVRVDPVGTGRFRFHRWSRESSLEITADTANYRGRPGLDRVIWSVAPDFQTAAAKLFGGEADLYAGIRPDYVAELVKHPRLRLVTLPGMSYVFMGFNLRDPKSQRRPHPLFASRELRRALTMALDRPSLVSNVYDTLAPVALGPTVRAFPTTDTTLRQIPSDPRRAAVILDSLGWVTRPGEEMRRREGKALEFDVLVSASAQPRMRMAVLMQEQLRRVGVRMRIASMEGNTLRARFGSRDFDAIMWDWSYGATPNQVRQTWGGDAARSEHGHNRGGYQSSRFDVYVDSAILAMNPADARRYFTSAYQTIVDDAPAIWLYEPKTVIGLDRRIRTGRMRLDAWWIDLGDWLVPESEQIPRDRIARSR
ncbi:MAG TPA: peptide ABC transporter substrate-binding protein [Gemmatimonadaceae bacterium]|nr:peptide ABC transporter substrate-binding protein [Gemmatimonadaceae bacterium]